MAREPKTTPPLGPDGEEARICHRFSGTRDDGSWIPCGEPAVIHVFWTIEGLENAYVCEEHKEEAINRWRWWRWHDLGADCGMPGARFYPEENVCRRDEDDPLVEEPVRRELVMST